MGECDFIDVCAIIGIAVFALGIVDNPRLVGKTVPEMSDCEWNDIVERLHYSEISAVCQLLETHELEDAVPFSAHFPSQLGYGKDGRVGKVGMDWGGRVYYFFHVPQEEHGGFGRFRKPAISE